MSHSYGRGKRRQSSLAHLLLNTVLPGASELSKDTTADALVQRQVVTNEMLQILLYYNFYYDLVFGVLNACVLRWKWMNNNEWTVKFLSPIIGSLWMLFESSRLWLGYAGNLQEKVPHLAAFFFLTLLPQTIFTIFFMKFQQPLLAFDKITGAIMLAFLASELIFGYYTVRQLIRSQTIRFRLDYQITGDSANDASEIDTSKQTSSDDPRRSTTFATKRTSLSSGGAGYPPIGFISR